MPGHTPEHNQQTLSGTAQGTSRYRVYGTNEPYSGRTVEIGGYMYSTVGGALEGDSLQLIPLGSDVNTDPNLQSTQEPITSLSTNNNPVTRTFISRTTYYRQDGTPVPSGAELHQHQDGTIMLGRDPNNMGAIVTPTLQQSPDFNILTSGNGGNTGGNMGGGGGGY